MSFHRITSFRHHVGGWASAVLALCVTAWTTQVSALDVVRLVADIATEPGSSDPSDIVEANGKAFFAAYDGVHGRELWQTDGTPAGTLLFDDLNPGWPDSGVIPVTSINSALYFVADAGAAGAGIWKTDGTGTTLVKTADPQVLTVFEFFNVSIDSLYANVNGTLFFASVDVDTLQSELWKSDGTPSGTVRIKELGFFYDAMPTCLTDLNGSLLFIVSSEGAFFALWRSDGTEAGTTALKSLYDYNESFPLVNVNGTVYFVSADWLTGDALWQTDGTAAGTVASPGGTDVEPYEMVKANGLLLFAAADWATYTTGLWKADGTGSGVQLVQEFGYGVSDYPYSLACAGGTTYFLVGDPDYGPVTLWKTDGTTAGTLPVRALPTGYPWGLTGVGGRVFFVMDDVDLTSETL